MSELATLSLNGQPAEDGYRSSSSDADAVMLQISAGGLLKQAREAAGLQIAALAVALKVPVKKLEALESDQFDLLPDGVFVRALASSVCRTLKIDAAPVLQRLPQTSSPKLRYKSAGINVPFRAPGDRPSPSIWTHISRPAVLAGLILLMAALVLIFLPTLPDIGRADVVNPSTGNREPASPGIAVSSALLTPAQPIAAPGNPASAALTSTGIVVFSAKSESWVEVTDSTGQVLLRRMLNAGEVVGATGALPLAAIVGRADAITVQVRGKDFDLSAVSKDNVARFEVK